MEYHATVKINKYSCIYSFLYDNMEECLWIIFFGGGFEAYHKEWEVQLEK